MEWFFRIFFGLLALCLVIYAGMTCRDLLSPRRSGPAVVRARRKRLFPVTVGLVRKDRFEYEVEFFLPVDQVTKTLSVSEAVYQICQTGYGGELTWQGARFIRFVSGNGDSQEPLTVPHRHGHCGTVTPRKLYHH